MYPFECETCGKTNQFIMDGYGFGDRLLEGIKFVVTVDQDNMLLVTLQNEGDLEGLDATYWMEEANKAAERWDMFTCPTCGEDMDLLQEDVVFKVKKHSKHLQCYLDGIQKLHLLYLQGRDESPEADTIRDALDKPWTRLTEDERERVRKFSEFLYNTVKKDNT